MGINKLDNIEVEGFSFIFVLVCISFFLPSPLDLHLML